MSDLKERQKELREKITTELAPKAIELLDTAMEASLSSGKTTDMVKAADAVLAYANLTKNKEEVALSTGAKIATAAITTALKGLAGLVGIEDVDIPELTYTQPEADLSAGPDIVQVQEIEEPVHEEENDEWSYLDE